MKHRIIITRVAAVAVMQTTLLISKEIGSFWLLFLSGLPEASFPRLDPVYFLFMVMLL